MKKTKIVATVGPACQTEEIIAEMLKAGVNVARFNFSHGTHEMHRENIAMFRRVRDSLGLPAAVMLDTKGPEIRLRSFEGGSAILTSGSEFTLTADEVQGNSRIASVSYKKLPAQLAPGCRVLINDGRIVLEVLSVSGREIHCRVIVGGTVSDRKGINVPSVNLDMPYLSEADKADLLLGVELDVDFVAASFVRRAADVEALRRFLDYNGGHGIKIISKIESLEGISNFEEILSISDGIMVARGDMGVEVDYTRLPGIQKKFIRRCYGSGKMVITATQMLESMTQNPGPTRAEITDVANAVFDGTSAVMLSGETAAGKYPVEAVRVMSAIVEQAEKDAFEMGAYNGLPYDMDSSDTTNAICDATCRAARDLGAAAVIAVTSDGGTARRMSKFRPKEPIIAATPKAKTFHQLALSWGVYPVMARMQATTDRLFLHAADCAKQTDIVKDGDRVVITAGIPIGISGTTNILRVSVIGEKT